MHRVLFLFCFASGVQATTHEKREIDQNKKYNTYCCQGRNLAAFTTKDPGVLVQIENQILEEQKQLAFPKEEQ